MRPKLIKDQYRDFPGGPVPKTQHSQCQGPELDSWSGIRPHMLKLKTLHAVTKIQGSQINK